MIIGHPLKKDKINTAKTKVIHPKGSPYFFPQFCQISFLSFI